MLRLALAQLRHRPGYAALLLLGAMLVAAGIGGALDLGASLQDLLQARVHQQAGPVDVVVHRGGRPLRAQLGLNLGKTLLARALPAVHRRGLIATDDLTLPGVDVWGFDARLHDVAPDLLPPDDAVTLPAPLAARLGVGPGDVVVLRVPRLTELPADASLRQPGRDHVAARVRVHAVVDPVWPLTLGVTAQPTLPDVALVNLSWMQRLVNSPSAATHLLLAGTTAAEVGTALAEAWSPDDAGLTFEHWEPGVALSGRGVLLPDAVVDATRRAWPAAQPWLVWYAESIAHDPSGRRTPASFVAAMPEGVPYAPTLSPTGAALSAWLANDLGASLGDSITLTVPVPEPGRAMRKVRSRFVVEHILDDELSLDRSLAPRIEGIQGAESCAAWDPGLPIDLSQVRPEDEAFWREHGASPKLFVRRDAVVGDWTGPDGDTTQVRAPGYHPNDAWRDLRPELHPADFGLTVLPLRAHLQANATPATDLGALFLGLQSILLGAAVILLVLLGTLTVAAHRHETGVLRALGFAPPRIRRLRVLQGLLPLGAGAILGGLATPLVGAALRAALHGPWSEAVAGAALPGALHPSAMLAGTTLATIAGLAAWSWGVRHAAVTEPHALLTGTPTRRAAPSLILAAAALAGALAATSLSDPAARPLAVAGLALLGALSLLHAALQAPLPGLIGQSLRRHPSRALALVAPLAATTFLVLAVQGHTPAPTDPSDPTSGTGGFTHWVETHSPVGHDLSTQPGRDALAIPAPDALAALRRVDGDDASCRHLGAAARPTILGLRPEDLRGRFTLHGGVSWSDLAPPAEGPIPVLADTHTATWALKRQTGEVFSLPGRGGVEVQVQLIGTLAPSILQGALLAHRDALNAFDDGGGDRVFLLQTPDPSPMQRGLRDHAVSIEPSTTRLHRFQAVERSYLAVFGALGGLGLLLGAMSAGLLLARAYLERRKERWLLGALGFSARRIAGLLAIEHGGLALLGLAMGAVAALAAS